MMNGPSKLVGKVIEVSPPTRLVITWANASQAADPSAYSRVTFEIEEYDGHGPADRQP